ncbi:MAG: hypothetical protein MSA15_11115, partial [Clostridium sp.]|nr:hypothetical protein [Clostridium sp.]
MKLEHILPANSLKNNNFYNAVIYTIDNGNDESVASVPIPFYCYTQPALTIDNIPSSGTIENGTYSFQGNYVQNEGELLNSYRFTLYDSNKTILAQSPLIYYNTDPSLTYLFSGMSNNTSYYIELTGETINSTILTSGVKSFTVRYIQPASFAICDLVNDCENGYIQISSNIVAIDGKSNPTPPIYIDDKEVDLREPDSWVEWDSGFSIKNDFTLRAWGRDFNPYEPIITLSNQQNTSSTPNKIEMKWMIADVLKVLPDYKRVSGQNINLSNSKAEPIEDIYVGGNTTQYKDAGVDYGSGTSLSIPAQDKVKPLKITVNGNQYQETTKGKQLLNPADLIATITKNGLTLTNNGDGTFNISGTATADTNFVLWNAKNIYEANHYFGLYSSVAYNVTNWNLTLAITYTDGTATRYITPTVPVNLTNTNVSTAFVVLYVPNGTVMNKKNVKVMLYKDDSVQATEWEEYTGGKPSPSSDYLQEVETVGDNINYFDKNNLSNTFVNGNTGSSQPSRAWRLTDYIVPLYKTYNFSWDSDSSYYQVNIIFYDKNKAFHSGIVFSQGGVYSKSFDVPDGIPYMRINYSVNVNNVDVTRENIKLEKGNARTAYSNYNQGSV